MTRILTVDDSRSIRTIVSKQVQEMGFETDEAEDGVQGLARLEECVYDLVVLDVTMPNMDGPAMLLKMRELGNKTPVLMLTSESKRSIISDAMKSGIEDYILKPFKPDELKSKIKKTLGKIGVAPAEPSREPSVGKPASHETPAVGRQFIDILIIDDMENVHKKLKNFLPGHLSMQGTVSAHSALSMCKERVYRVVIVDTDIPDVDSVALMGQLRAVQPHAAFLALILRMGSNPDERKEQGFDGVVCKPFDKDSIDDLLLQYFDNQDTLAVEDNVVTVGAFTGKEDRIPGYFQRLSGLLADALPKIAAACHDEVILDIVKLPLVGKFATRTVLEVNKTASGMGIELRLVGNDETKRLLQSITETKDLNIFATVADARNGA